MAIQTASALLISTFKSAVVPLKILQTDIFELGSSTNNPITFTFVCEVLRRKGFFVTINLAFTVVVDRIAKDESDNFLPGFRIAGFLNKRSVRPASPTPPAPDPDGDTFYIEADATEAQKNYGINLISQAIMTIRVPTRVVIDVAKIQIPIIALSSYTIELEEGFFRQESVISTEDPKLTNTNNQMPTLLNAPLVTLRTNSRPFYLLSSPSNGTTSSYINTKVRLRINSSNNLGQTGQDILNTLSPGTGFIRLYREGVLISTISCFDNKITFINNTIEVDYTGLLDANTNYYILIDNGFAVDRDGFATQAVTSNTQCFFRTAPSTDPEFPDLTGLQMSAANLLLPQADIIIYFSSDAGTFASLACDFEIVRYASGTTTSTASLSATSERTVRLATLAPMTFTLTASVNLVQAFGRANVTATSSLSLPFFQRNRQHEGNAALSSVSSIVANPGIPLTLVYNNPTRVGIVIRGDANLNGSDINFTVDWGDGTIQSFSGANNTQTGNRFTYSRAGNLNGILQPASGITSPEWNTRTVRYIEKVYSGSGIRTVRINGSFKGFQHNADGVDTINGGINGGDQTVTAGAYQLIRCDSWGEITGLTDLSGAFAYCYNLQSVPNKLPPGTTSLGVMFAFSKFNGPEIGSWNTSSVTTMAGMFNRNTYFNQPIGAWNTQNVTTFSHMFFGLQAGGAIPSNFNNSFNQNINTWNTSSATNMESMFAYKPSYNQPMNNWNVSNVTNMNSMFYAQTGTNQNISNWCVRYIPSRPFRWNTASTQTGFGFMVGANEPIWGTCP
jgi:hypothetical protein